MGDFISGFAIGATLTLVGMLGIGSFIYNSHRKEEAEKACTSATVLGVNDDHTTCSDGRVFLWKESYLTPVVSK